MRTWEIGAAALALPVCLAAAAWDNTQQKTFTLSGSGERRLIIENIQGDITIRAGSGNQVSITAKEHYSADDDAALSRARNDIRLEMAQSANEVKVTLEGPFRNRERNSWRERNEEHVRYNFRHDLEVTVPREIALDLKTVNGSTIEVTGTHGELNVHNVNGKIRLTDVAGYGRVRTVNGSVKVAFAQNPSKPVELSSVNGELDATFQPGLNADIRMSTMHGVAYTDFDVQPMAMPVNYDSRDGGKRIRIGRDRGIRIGSGGVEHTFKTLNGSIKIRKGGNSK